MPGILDNILGSGIGDLAKGVGDVIGKFVADPNQKVEAQLEVERLTNALNLQLITADKDFAVQQASVITAEAKSESWLARNWRPILMLTFTFIIAFNYILAPIINSFASDGKVYLIALVIPPDMWGLLKLGVSGYIVGRSVEKVMETRATKDITVASVQAQTSAANGK